MYSLRSFSCPQVSVNDLGKIARLLEGKKIADGVKLVVSAADEVCFLAQRTGYVDIIKKAGGVVVTGLCIMGFPYLQLEMPATIGATNSAKAASYQARRGINIQYGNFESCINAAITGKWGG